MGIRDDDASWHTSIHESQMLHDAHAGCCRAPECLSVHKSAIGGPTDVYLPDAYAGKLGHVGVGTGEGYAGRTLSAV